MSNLSKGDVPWKAIQNIEDIGGPEALRQLRNLISYQEFEEVMAKHVMPNRIREYIVNNSRYVKSVPQLLELQKQVGLAMQDILKGIEHDKPQI